MNRSTEYDLLDTSGSLEGPLSSRCSSGFSPGKKAGPPSLKSRRGGFGASGTLGQNGELPVAPVVQFATEKQLHDEISCIVSGLDINIDWDQRVNAMLRLEGLVKGGAAQVPTFASDMLSSLHPPLAEQLQDRRSAISRQACHLISTVVQALGSRAEPFAAALQPVIFKAQGMSIQIVTEASDACLRTLITHCPSSRFLPMLCSNIKTNKNVKLRTSAADYLYLAVREWDMNVIEKHAEAVESSIMSAAQDAAAETREIGRSMFISYYSKKPSAAHAMLKRLPDSERSLKEKLQNAVKRALGSGELIVRIEEPARAATNAANEKASKPPALPPLPGTNGSSSSLNNSPKRAVRVPKLAVPSPRLLPSSRPELPGSMSARAPSPVPVAAASLPKRPASAASSPAPAKRLEANTNDNDTNTSIVSNPLRSARRSLGGAALRVVAPANQAPAFASPDSRPTQPSTTGPRRCLATPATSLKRSIEIEPMVIEPPNTAAARRVIAVMDLDQGDNDIMSLPDAVEALTRSGLGWDTKVSLYEAIQKALDVGAFISVNGHNDNNNDMLTTLARLLIDGISDAHFKVAAAALEALSGALRCPQMTATLELHIELLSPVLFVRLTDAKEQIRQLTGNVVDLLPRVINPESIMHGLAASLNSTKAPKVLCAIMDYFAELITANTKRGRDPADSGPARAMLSGCLPLATHKHQDVRQSALAAVAAVYFAGENSAAVVRSAIEILPPKSAEAIKRGITQAAADSRSMQVDMEPESLHATPLSASKNNGNRLSSVSPATTQRPPFQLPSPPSFQSPGVPSFSPSPVSPLGLPECPVSSKLDMQRCSISPAPPQSLSKEIDTSPPLSAHTVPQTQTQDFVVLQDPPPTKKMTTPSRTVVIKVDATATVQTTQPTQPPSLSPLWSPHASDELQLLLNKLYPVPMAASMAEALRMAPELEGEEKRILCSAVQSALLTVLEQPTPDATILEASLTASSELASLMPKSTLEETVPALLRHVILAQGHENEAVAFAAEKCAQQLVGTLHAPKALDLLIPLLPKTDKRPPFEGERAIVSLGAVRLLKMILPSLTTTNLASVLATVLPPSCVCYTSANAVLRRAAVEYIVALHLKFTDDELRPHLSSLSLAQSRLVDIYVDRARKSHAVTSF